MQRNTLDTNLWLRGQDRSNTTRWYRLCLALARAARNAPAGYPTAFSAQHATPEKYRVHDLSKVKRGMVAYFDNPHDDNPFGHIVTVQGRSKAGELFCWSNDVNGPGMVSLVQLSYFPSHWNVQFQFAATWLNGIVLDMPGAAVKKPKQRPNIQDAIDSLNVAIKKNKGDTRLVNALKRDRDHLVTLLKRFS